MLSRARSSPPRENAAVCPRGPDLSSPSPPSHPLPEPRGSLSLARARSLLLLLLPPSPEARRKSRDQHRGERTTFGWLARDYAALRWPSFASVFPKTPDNPTGTTGRRYTRVYIYIYIGHTRARVQYGRIDTWVNTRRDRHCWTWRSEGAHPAWPGRS